LSPNSGAKADIPVAPLWAKSGNALIKPKISAQPQMSVEREPNGNLGLRIVTKLHELTERSSARKRKRCSRPFNLIPARRWAS
jgi:hypothetical protein